MGVSFPKFPRGFLWGAACSAYQIEGAWNEGGKGENCSDHCARQPETEKFFERGRPDVCSDFYHHYREDIGIMRENSLNSFRFSISWPRLFPNGPYELNQQGVDYYNDLFNTLIENGISPFIDLFHWDLPQWVYDRGGPVSYEFVEWFEHYARTAFSLFGDRVKYWSTMNEPNFSFGGYTDSAAYIYDKPGGAPPYEKDVRKAFAACHFLNLAHLRAVRAYREMGQDGKIGMVIDAFPFYPYSLGDSRDEEAAERAMDFYFGKWLGPMMLGRYPDVIVDSFSELMPENFQSDIAKEYVPMDFVGENYYASGYAYHIDEKPYYDLCGTYETVDGADRRHGYHIGYCPEGFYDILMILTKKYHAKEIIVTENGTCFRRDMSRPAEPTDVHDEERIKYLRAHIPMMARAIEAGANVTGYHIWAIEDTYEHGSGRELDFGLIAVNYDTMERTARDSFKWYGALIRANS